MSRDIVIKDAPNERLVEFSDGGHAKLKRTDPYGFWHIEWHKGPTPEQLSGQSFTTAEQARQTVIRFVNSKDYRGYASVVETKVETAPPLQYKKRFRKEEVQTL